MISAAEAILLAKRACVPWGGAMGQPVPANIRENIVCRVDLPDGQRAAVRLHRPAYQTRAGIEAELTWTARLAARGLPVPRPIRTKDGDLTALVDGRTISMVSWLPGGPLGAAGVALSGSASEQVAQFADIGRLIGTMHSLTDQVMADTSLPRPRWDIDGLLGPQPLWGRFWDNPGFSGADKTTILAARDCARDRLATLLADGADFGLIHADVMRENILRTPQGLALIDFDDSGYGFRLYDLGTALLQNLEEPHLPALAQSMLQGYRAAHPGKVISPSDLTLFVALRCFASAGWVMTRVSPDDPAFSLRAQRALRLARYVLDGSALF